MFEKDLPIPDHFRPDRVDQIWKVPYQIQAEKAAEWARQWDIPPAHQDDMKIGLLLIDVQNTFCIPGFELFVAGRSGTGAVGDNRRLCEFIYRNLGHITQIFATLDTHTAMQIFHSIFFVNEEGGHPPAMTMISADDLRQGRWQFNPALANQLQRSEDEMRDYLVYYAGQLEKSGKFLLTIWPYHAMQGGIGNALVPAVEEAIFFHTIARQQQARMITKGGHPLTEHYSVFRPEVLQDHRTQALGEPNIPLFRELLNFDAVIIAGEAKSHCVAWSVADLLAYIQEHAPERAERIYLLDDCSSPVCIPGVVDFTDEAENWYRKFSDAGMHRVKSTDPMNGWPGLPGNLG